MKYDFSKCNNLRYVYKDYTGFIKTDGDYITLLLDESPIDTNGIPRHKVFTYTHISAILDNLASPEDFRIIPRDPRTYDDWQVGDKIKILDNDIETVVEVGVRMNNIVICFNSRGYWGTYTCEELKRFGELILTDYERTLIQVPKYVFNQGDKVLARMSKGDAWLFGTYVRASEDDAYLYNIKVNDQCYVEYNECIPYNEHTWRLLGTTEDYKEDDGDND